MKKIHYILLIILVIVGAVRLAYEYRGHKDELMATARFESRQRAVAKKGAPKVQMVASVLDMEKIFNDNLPSCTPVNIAMGDDTNYVIYGKDGGNCSFEKYTPSLCLQCLVPTNVAEKYSRAWNGVDSYINEVNNNSDYCKVVSSDKTKQAKKGKNKEKD